MLGIGSLFGPVLAKQPNLRLGNTKVPSLGMATDQVFSYPDPRPDY